MKTSPHQFVFSQNTKSVLTPVFTCMARASGHPFSSEPATHSLENACLCESIFVRILRRAQTSGSTEVMGLAVVVQFRRRYTLTIENRPEVRLSQGAWKNETRSENIPSPNLQAKPPSTVLQGYSCLTDATVVRHHAHRVTSSKLGGSVEVDGRKRRGGDWHG